MELIHELIPRVYQSHRLFGVDLLDIGCHLDSNGSSTNDGDLRAFLDLLCMLSEVSDSISFV